MNRYLIQHRVRTTIVLHNKLECRGYSLYPMHQNVRGGFLVKREVEAEGYNGAYKIFAAGLKPILDAASIITQCAVTGLRFASCCLYKLNDNPEELAYFRYADETETVGMMLREEELADIERVLHHMGQTEADKAGIEYLSQAILASGPLFFLAMLVVAVEAFAGDEQVERRCQKGHLLKCECGIPSTYPRTSRAAVEEIIGTPLKRELYGEGRLRHKLLHGGAVNEGRVAEVAKQSYEQILLNFVTNKYHLTSVRKIADAPRSMTFESTGLWVKVNGQPDLHTLEQNRERLVAEPPPVAY